MNARNRISNRLSIKLDLPDELFFQSLVEIIGNNRVIIENHRGIVQYEDCHISIKTDNGFIDVLGEQLTLVKIAKEQLVIVGFIHQVVLNNRSE